MLSLHDAVVEIRATLNGHNDRHRVMLWARYR